MTTKTSPLISVLMPAYNAEKYIGEAIQSVLNQTFQNFELIVVNDGSTDRTKEIICSFQDKDKRIKYAENETNSGIVFTRNRAVELAQGEYCAILDADDVCLPFRLEKQWNFMESHPDYALCGSWAYLINEKSEPTGKVKFIDTNELLHISFLFTCNITHSSVMLRAGVLKKFRYRTEAPVSHDMDLWLRLTNAGLKMANLPEYLIKYRWHEKNVSHTKEEKQREIRKKLLTENLQAFLDREISDKEYDLHQFSFRMYQFGHKKSLAENGLKTEKQWFRLLRQRNKEVNRYSQTDFDAFLFSRWLVCCIFTKKYVAALDCSFRWWKPSVIFKAVKLLIYK